MRSLRPLYLCVLALALASCESVTSPMSETDSGFAAHTSAAAEMGTPDTWADRQVAVCHAVGAKGYQRVLVPQQAVRAHLRHGDELAGGAMLDAQCEPVAPAAACTCFEAADLAAPLAGAQPLPYLFADVFNYYHEDLRRTEIRSTLSTDGGLLEEVAAIYITAAGNPEPLVPLCFRQNATLDAMTGGPIYTYTTREVSIDEAEACRLEVRTFAEGQQACQGEACGLPYAEEQLDPNYPPYHDDGFRTPVPVLDALRARIAAVRAQLVLPGSSPSERL